MLRSAAMAPAHATEQAGQAAARRGEIRMEGATIVDPRDGSLVHGASIRIKDGRIAGISAARQTDESIKGLDLHGKFVVPGYNDMHTHVLELENPSGALALMLAEGVTGFRQMSGSPHLLAGRRSRSLPIGQDAPALLELPGTVLTPLNAGSESAVVEEIRLQKAQGADFIKVGFVAPSVLLAAMQEAKLAGIPILGHLQDGVDPATASRMGFRSVEHLGPGATLWVACSSRDDEFKDEPTAAPIKAPPKHIPFLRALILWRLQTMLINPAAFGRPEQVARLRRAIDSFSAEKCRALAQRFVDEDTWHVPTLVRLRSGQLASSPEYAADPYLKYMPRNKVKKWRAVTRRFGKLPATMRETYALAYSRQLELTKALADSGVRMMTGTDGGWLSGPGLTLKEEFAELAKAGLSPQKILQMATINAAEYMHRTQTMGTVQEGRNADLVILNANPLEAVANLHDIAGVVRAGTYISAQELGELKRRVADGRGFLH
jgi:imidazolonepropionase-like amidohydrolase